MKKILFTVACLALTLTLMASESFARSVRVGGYTKRDGAYVAPHQRTAPDGSKMNNWSTKGNINPYTGKQGTKRYW